MFQSTLPYGSDFLIASPALPMPDFNPHSLTGATFSSNASSTSSAFQSTLPRGSDRNSVRCSDKICQFQSTLPRGSDPFFNRVKVRTVLFQSTLPRGSDLANRQQLSDYKNFNPRSLAGATVYVFIICSLLSYFNPRSLAGATSGIISVALQIFFISIHAPSRERPAPDLVPVVHW